MTALELRFVGVETDDGGQTMAILAATPGGSIRKVRLTDAQAFGGHCQAVGEAQCQIRAVEGPMTAQFGAYQEGFRAGQEELLRYYSAALDEVYRLRAALAHEREVRRADLALKTYPKSRRSVAIQAMDRMVMAANGFASNAYAHPEIDLKAALRAVGADECLTRSQWEEEVDR